MEDSTFLATPTKKTARQRSSRTQGETKLNLENCSAEQLITLVLKAAVESEQYEDKISELELDRDELESNLHRVKKVFESDFSNAKTKINELMNSQLEMETELSGRIEVLDKLRTSLRETDREKKQLDTRYREQTESFDSERQSWYDQEQHYKVRIANLSSAPRIARLSDKAKEVVESTFPVRPIHLLRSQSSSGVPDYSPPPSPTTQSPQNQLSSLTTAHDSLTTTTRALQKELAQLKRANQELQGENESYELLLGEKTMNGQLLQSNDLFTRNWLTSDDEGYNGFGNQGLESVGESEEEGNTSDSSLSDDPIEGSPKIHIRHASTTTLSPNPRGKRRTQKKRPSGGLSLAAELEASEEENAQEAVGEVKKRLKHQPSIGLEGDALRAEVKSLKEANKALTLYVSKIVDRVCSQEGFEKVLAVDYKLTPKPLGSGALLVTPSASDLRNLPTDHLSTKNLDPVKKDNSPTPPPTTKPPSTAANRELRNSRRPMSIDWQSATSFFSSALSRSSSSTSTAPLSPPLQPAGFKPMLLDVSSSLSRRVSADEDEDDIKERERLKAELALHGIVDTGHSATRWNGSASTNLRNSTTGVSIPTLSTSTGLPSSNKRSSVIMNRRSTVSPPIPEPIDLDRFYDSSTPSVQLSSPQLTLQTLKTVEKEQIEELQNGAGSGLTEIQFRRRGTSTRSNSSNGDTSSLGSGTGMSRSRMNSSSEGIGLGVNLASYGASPVTSPDLGHPLLENNEGWGESPKLEGEGTESWGTRVAKRISRSTWTAT